MVQGQMSTALSGKRRPTEHISHGLLNELTVALKTAPEVILSDDQKLRLEDLMKTSQIMDSVSGHTITEVHEIVSSKRVRVLRGKPGMGLEWRFDDL